MSEIKEQHINPFTEDGFKKLFGKAPTKELLFDFLNELYQERVLEQLFEVAKFTREELLSPEDNLKYSWDLKKSLDTASKEGEDKKSKEVIKKGLQEGLTVEVLSTLTGWSKEEIKEINQKS